MIGYLFWHWPDPDTGRPAYEAAQRAFHAALGAAGVEGFQSSMSFRVSGLPWIPGGSGYEDWYLLDGSHALDPLNEAAVSPALAATHAAAARAATGAGGLYRLLRGVPGGAGGRVTWLSRPRGSPFAAFHEQLGESAAVWRRQMVLGPAPEFLLEGPAPHGMAALEVQRERYC